MKVRQGWTGETVPGRWSKVDVEVDEVDLRRILLEAGVTLDAIPSMTTAEVFVILSAEAERCVLLRLVSGFGYPPAEAKSKIEAAVARRAKTLTAVQERVAPAP